MLIIKKLLKIGFSLLAISTLLSSKEVNATNIKPDSNLYTHYATTVDTAKTSNIGWRTMGYFITKDTIDEVSHRRFDVSKIPTSGVPYAVQMNHRSDPNIDIIQYLYDTNEKENKYTFHYYIADESIMYLRDLLALNITMVNGNPYYMARTHKIFGVGPTTNSDVKAKYQSNSGNWFSDIKDKNGRVLFKSGAVDGYYGYILSNSKMMDVFSWNKNPDYFDHYNMTFALPLKKVTTKVVTQTEKGEGLLIYPGATAKGLAVINSESVANGYEKVPEIVKEYTTGTGDNKKTYRLVRAYSEATYAHSYDEKYFESATHVQERFFVGSGFGAYDKNSYAINFGARNLQVTALYNQWVDTINNSYFKVGAKSGTVYLIYREIPPEPKEEVEEDSDHVSRDYSFEYSFANPDGEITADPLDNSKYDVESGIPSGETVNSRNYTEQYLYRYTNTKHKGYIEVVVPVQYNYYYYVTSYYNERDEDGNIVTKETSTRIDDTKTVQQKVRRDYQYWELKEFELLQPKSTVIKNNSFGTVTIASNAPKVTAKYTKLAKKPTAEDIYDNRTVIVNAGYTMNPNTSGAQAEAEKVVKQFMVRNDYHEVNGVVYMKSDKVEKKTETPTKVKYPEYMLGSEIQKDKIQIPTTKANGYYSTSATMEYEPVLLVNTSGSIDRKYKYAPNALTVHTPVYITGNVDNNKAQNQMATPITNLSTIVLTVPFSLSVSNTGEHLDYLGYGTQNYSKYVSSNKVSFGFDVIRNGSYYRAGSIMDANGTFTVPAWVEEDQYQVKFYAYAVNLPSGNTNEEHMLNSNYDNYIVTDETEVYITGRMYNFSVYDISDYPMWESVFRLKTDQPTGTKYTVGRKNQNGSSNGQGAKYTLPLIDGKHPTYKNIGSVKSGYYIRYSLQTLGSMGDNVNDTVKIKPRFYFVDKNGGNRTEVDVYYNETFGGKLQSLVKVGSNLDSTNTKKLQLGSEQLMVPNAELKSTATATGKTLKEVRGSKTNSYTFDMITLGSHLRTLVGTLSGKPNHISDSKAISSIQNWYGEYYLPSAIYAAPKGFDVYAEGRKKSLNFTESFWKRDGYIIVNFEILSFNNGARNLSYTNPLNAPNGYANMWAIEGFSKIQTDNNNKTFNFLDGDVFLYKLTGTGGGKKDSAAADYKGGGTH